MVDKFCKTLFFFKTKKTGYTVNKLEKITKKFFKKGEIYSEPNKV